MTTLPTASVVTVACPAWCNVTQSTHQRELRWEGRALHWSDARTGEGWEIRHTAATDANGHPTNDRAPGLRHHQRWPDPGRRRGARADAAGDV